MICPECKNAGQKYTTRVGGVTTTMAARRRYYDGEGGYHIHDSNRVTQAFSCSNGHNWSERVLNRCTNPKCGWTQDV